jgi:uncharacterized protein (TIGR03067 family)
MAAVFHLQGRFGGVPSEAGLLPPSRRFAMRIEVIMILATSWLGVPDRPKKVDRVKQEVKKLEGAWKAVAIEHLGRELKGSGITLTFTGHKYAATTVNGVVMEEGTYQIDPSKKPKTMTLSILSGKDKGTTQNALYELQGDTLKICLAQPGKDRPAGFTTKSGTGFEIFMMKRVKK